MSLMGIIKKTVWPASIIPAGLIWFTVFISCKDKNYLLQQLDVQQTGIDFINHVSDDSLFNILTYPYLFNGAGVGIGDFNNDGLEDIFFR